MDKTTKYISELQRLRLYLEENTASRYMAAIETGIPIQNICRYIEVLRRQGLIAVVRKDHCLITGEIVEFLSTNPALFPKEKQLILW